MAYYEPYDYPHPYRTDSGDATISIGVVALSISGYIPGVLTKIFSITESASIMYVDHLDDIASFSELDAAHVLHLFRSELLVGSPLSVPIGSGSLAVSGQQSAVIADANVAITGREKIVPIGTQIVTIY